MLDALTTIEKQFESKEDSFGLLVSMHNKLALLFFLTFIWCMCACVHMCHSLNVEEEGNFQGSVLSFHHVVSGD